MRHNVISRLWCESIRSVVRADPENAPGSGKQKNSTFFWNNPGDVSVALLRKAELSLWALKHKQQDKELIKTDNRRIIMWYITILKYSNTLIPTEEEEYGKNAQENTVLIQKEHTRASQ